MVGTDKEGFQPFREFSEQPLVLIGLKKSLKHVVSGGEVLFSFGGRSSEDCGTTSLLERSFLSLFAISRLTPAESVTARQVAGKAFAWVIKPD